MPAMTIEDLLKGSEQRLGLNHMSGSSGLKKQTYQVQVQFLENDFSPELLPGVILIIPSSVCSQWTNIHEKSRKVILKKIISSQIPGVFLSGSQHIPDFLYHLSEQNRIPFFASIYDEFLLESRLKGLLREKINQIIFMHGVLLNMFGRGILMKGDSGIGKTTLAMKLAQRGHVWVADDAIEIEKKDTHHLYARGHDRSRHLVDMKALGVWETRCVMMHGDLRDETILHMVIEYVEEYDVCPCSSLRKKETCDIMGVKLPYFELPVQGRGYIAESQIENIIHAFLTKGERS